MLLKMHPDPTYYNTSVITASNNGTTPNGYASLLYRMMYGVDPDLSSLPENSTFYFVAKCVFPSFRFEDDLYSSWRQVDFTLRNGILNANVTEKRCPNPRGPDVSGFADLYFALEGAGAVLGSSDGYSKLFNENEDDFRNTSIFKNMSRIDAAVNQIYHIVQNAWSQQTHNYSIRCVCVR
jgi:hypothetical protein